jgi:C4-dicarboxylate transporter, DctQ subunit
MPSKKQIRNSKHEIRNENSFVKLSLMRRSFWLVFDRILDLLTALAGLILAFIVVAVCYTIGLRYLFSRTTIWIIQTTEYALLWIVFLSTAWLLREGGHITTDIVTTGLPDKTRRILDGAMFALGGLTCGLLVYLGVAHTWDCLSHQVTDVRAVTVPKAAIFIIIPLGSLLLTVQFFRMSWDRLFCREEK